MPENSAFEKAIVPFFIDNWEIFNFEFLICYVITWFNGYMVLWVEPLHPQSPPCQAWRP